MDFYKIIISLLLLVIIILLGIFTVIAFHFYKKVKKETTGYKTEKIAESGFCYIHNETSSVGMCSICDKDICASCVKQIDKISLCPVHIKTYIQNRWVPITNQKTTPETPEAGLYIYNFKRMLWKDEAKPSFVMNDYKINIQDDFIETYLQLYVIEEDSEMLSKKIISKNVQAN